MPVLLVVVLHLLLVVVLHLLLLYSGNALVTSSTVMHL